MGNQMKSFQQAIDAAQQRYNELQEEGSRADLEEASDVLRSARSALVTFLTAGSKPCQVCGCMPHALVQPVGKGLQCIEIGCLNCPHRRVRGFTPALAVEAWNDGS